MPDQLYKLLRKRTAKVEQLSATVMDYEINNPQYVKDIVPLVADDIEIGLEIEIERVGANAVCNYEVWTRKQDNSLRDHGLEYVSCPIKGKRITYALNQFFDNINKGYRFSPRTSIHVHLNVLNLFPKEIASLALVYAVFEKLLYRFVGGDRDKNNFCVPMCETSAVDDIVQSFTQDNYMPQPYDNLRYLGLNFDSVRKFGTLEFRHLGGTDNKAKIANWINLIFRLKQYAQEKSYEQIHEEICQLNTNSAYMIFFENVWKDQKYLLYSGDLKKDMEQNVSIVKRIVINNPMWEIVLKASGEKAYWIQRYRKKTAPKSTYIFPNQGLRIAPRRVREPFEINRIQREDAVRAPQDHEEILMRQLLGDAPPLDQARRMVQGLAAHPIQVGIPDEEEF